jgi:hypothetical protein
MRIVFLSAAISLGVCAVPALAGSAATFTVLDVSDAPDVTVDEFGRTLVLTLDGGYGGPMYVYDSGSYNYIGDGWCHHISADGTTVPGTVFGDVIFEEAAKWTVGGGFERLGWLPDALQCPSNSNGWDASADGSVVVGLSWDGCSGRGFKWTAEEGMTELESLGNGNNRASVVSDDGQVIAGFAQGSFDRTPAVWNASDNSGWLFDIDGVGEIAAINADGSMLAGRYDDDTISTGYQEPFYWTAETGVVFIPSLPEYPGGYVLGMSADGRTLVGNSGIIVEGRTAMVWRPEWGSVELTAKLEELGASVPDNFFPQVARGVTADGQTVVGWGISEGVFRGFVATLPPAIDPCNDDLNGDGQVGFTDLTQLLGSWGPCPACPEDLDGDGAVGFTDLTQLLGSWGPCV